MDKLGYVQCICSVSYTILHGGKELGPIATQRDLRQGDPLLPYLFILCAKSFSSLLRSYEQSGLLTGYKIALGAPIISHMLFADESYIYIFNNTNCALRDAICASLEIYEVDENGYYLGLPCSVGRNKNTILGFLKDKLRKRIQGWEGCILSCTGKEVLLNFVAQALPNYAMNFFLLPSKTCKELERLMAKFWWHSDSNSWKGINWMSWDRLFRHKHAWGLGFRCLRDFNLALLGK
ncbi:uncharacterized protein LOC115695359 [Cannabis sativa]|uniref:uncharacterized protein LOC115695359 n=1 Tax=Cannabis sativa TaxID=3483 RepID=UPI0011DF20A8|nr:uncharacterized protein LOC115695359 [Cannabis sativa]